MRRFNLEKLGITLHIYNETKFDKYTYIENNF